MADNNEDVEGNTSRGNEWEVVSLTASTYAAAPGPKEVESKDDEKEVEVELKDDEKEVEVELKDDEKEVELKDDEKEVELKDDGKNNVQGEDEAETSHALFMSRHFVFPPSQHENLPLEADNTEIIDEHSGKNVASEVGVQEGGKSGGKDEENWPLKGLNVAEEFPGIPIYEKGDPLSISGKEFEESSTLHDLNVSDKEQSIYSTTTFSSYHSETGLGGSTTYEENLGVPESDEPSERGLDFPADTSQSPKADEDDKYDGSNLPCEAWWKRRAASLYAHAKETNAFWSIFIAAAVMGLVILGQRWQQERWQVLQLKLQVSINNEKNGRLLGPIYRLKDAIVGGNRRGSFIRGSSSSEN